MGKVFDFNVVIAKVDEVHRWLGSLGAAAVPPPQPQCARPFPPTQVVKVKPHDKDAKMKYQECNKIVKQKAFERAIAGDGHKRSVVDSLDIESMTIEDEYSGPSLQDDKVTITFMKGLMQWYKDQKKLHQKCTYQVMHLSGTRHPGTLGWHHSTASWGH
nr:protein PPP5D1-like [Pongo pygmaeus]